MTAASRAPDENRPRGGARSTTRVDQHQTHEGAFPMTTPRATDSLSRRTALAGIGAGGLGLALAAVPRLVAAKDIDMASHPIVGTWLAGRAPNDISAPHWGADGIMATNNPTVGVGADGQITYSDSSMGSWVPVSERGIHFVFTNRTYDATGALTGYFTVEGFPVVSEDGMSFWDDGTQAFVTIRDAGGTVVQVIPPGIPGIGGVRLIPGKSGYDEMLAMLASLKADTPSSSAQSRHGIGVNP
jgi:hypothetical protein